MSLVIYDGTDGLIDKLGHWFGIVRFLVDNRQDVIDAINDAYAAYSSEDLYMTSAMDAIKQRLKAAGVDPAVIAAHQTAVRTLIDFVDDAIPLNQRSIQNALTVLREQMILQSETVNDSSTSASATYQGTPAGDGTMIFPTIGQLAYTQDITARCVRDAYTGTLVGAELFEVTSPAPKQDPYSLVWGTGSGYFARVPALDYLARSGVGTSPGQQALTNGAWTYIVTDTPAAPPGWEEVTGGEGMWGGIEAIVGDDGMMWMEGPDGLQVARQNLDGSAAPLLIPNARYIIGFWIKRNSTAPSGGGVSFSVVGDGGTPLATASIADASITTSWQRVTATFETTDMMPIAPYAQIARTVTELSGGATLYLSAGFLSIPHSLGTGQAAATLGQYLIVPGPTQFRNGDTIIGAIENNRGGEVQMWFDRFFGTAQLGIVLPWAGSPTIPDSVIPTL